jgi:hypothetical protein
LNFLSMEACSLYTNGKQTCMHMSIWQFGNSVFPWIMVGFSGAITSANFLYPLMLLVSSPSTDFSPKHCIFPVWV